MLKIFQIIFIHNDFEFPGMGGRNRCFNRPVNKRFRLHPVSDQISNGADANAVLFGKFFQRRHSGHGSVIIHYFANDTGRIETGQAG